MFSICLSFLSFGVTGLFHNGKVPFQIAEDTILRTVIELKSKTATLCSTGALAIVQYKKRYLGDSSTGHGCHASLSIIWIMNPHSTYFSDTRHTLM